ncbi:uncharacterized protein DS421_20g687990 [Arachis hypogaea]|nr:uncharacterized protein DS421_20g687990 [Arachis hypogaea]
MTQMNANLKLFCNCMRKGSLLKTRRRIDRGREDGHERLFNDYFAPNLVYSVNIFLRRLRMEKYVLLHIVEALSKVDLYFLQRVSYDIVDDYV